MKSLKESLFDSDLVSQKLQYEELVDQIKSHKKLIHIATVISAPPGKFNQDSLIRNVLKDSLRCSEKLIDDLYLPLAKWFDEFMDKRKQSNIIVSSFSQTERAEYKKMTGIYNAIQWLKFGEIHTTTCFNDKMYASELDVPYHMLENANKWICWKDGSDLLCMSNQKDFDYQDRMIIDALIDNVAKYYKKGIF